MEKNAQVSNGSAMAQKPNGANGQALTGKQEHCKLGRNAKAPEVEMLRGSRFEARADITASQVRSDRVKLTYGITEVWRSL
jgi:hypothetical protein